MGKMQKILIVAHAGIIRMIDYVCVVAPNKDSSIQRSMTARLRLVSKNCGIQVYDR